MALRNRSTDIESTSALIKKNIENNRSSTLVSTSSKQYELNIDRSLSKKLTAAKRVQHLCIEEKDGGKVITADAATFELVKRAAIVLYTNYPNTNGQAKINECKDSTGRKVVQYTIRIYSSDGKGYTVYVYSTTSRLTVNGKNPELFLDQYFVEIQNTIKNVTFMGKSCDINKINELIVKQIDSYLTNKKAVKTGIPECV